MLDIFIAYSHEDLAFKNELKKFLRPMLREERISVWDDFDIEAGQDWDAKIKERLYSTDIILLLVSSDSLASDYFYGKEVEVSLERHAKGEAVVVPVILRHSDWENTPLGGLEALPEKGRPVVEWPTPDQAWQDTVNRLRRVVENIEKQRKKETGQEQKTTAAKVEEPHRPEAVRPAAQAGTGISGNRRLLFSAFGAAALVVAIWLTLRPGPTGSPAQKQSDITENPEQLEDASYQKALTVNTISALQGFISRYPEGKNATQARQQLTRLQQQYKNYLNDADLFMADDHTIACGYLQKALALSPGDADVLQKLKKLKCN